MEQPGYTCSICPLLDTKPENIPVKIMTCLSWALQHDKRQKMGLRIQDEDKLTPIQWAALEGLCDGRSKYEEETQKREKEQQAQQPPPIANRPPGMK